MQSSKLWVLKSVSACVCLVSFLEPNLYYQSSERCNTVAFILTWTVTWVLHGHFNIINSALNNTVSKILYWAFHLIEAGSVGPVSLDVVFTDIFEYLILISTSHYVFLSSVIFNDHINRIIAASNLIPDIGKLQLWSHFYWRVKNPQITASDELWYWEGRRLNCRWSADLWMHGYSKSPPPCGYYLYTLACAKW